MRNIVLIFIALLLVACSKSMETKVEEMVSAKNKWLSVSEGKDYKYTMLIKGHHVNATRIIEVVGGKPINTKPKELATIQSLFEYAFDTIKSTDSKIEITYDSRYGYPNKIKTTIPEVIGGSSTIIVQDLAFK